MAPLNAARASAGLPLLVSDHRLDSAALAHATDMAANGFFAHAGSDGSTPGKRALAAGCRWTRVAENIASGQTIPAAAIELWLQSPGHRANILGPYDRLGQARAGTIWVTVFATGCDATARVDAARSSG